MEFHFLVAGGRPRTAALRQKRVSSVEGFCWTGAISKKMLTTNTCVTVICGYKIYGRRMVVSTQPGPAHDSRQVASGQLHVTTTIVFAEDLDQESHWAATTIPAARRHRNQRNRAE